LALSFGACDEQSEGPEPEPATSTGGESTGAGTEGETASDSEGETEAGSGDESGESSVITGRNCPPDAFVDAQNFGMPLMLTHCNGCHSASLPESMRQDAPLGIDFDTIEDVREHAERIYARAADNSETMPPVGGPTSEERVWLGDWLACGSP